MLRDDETVRYISELCENVGRRKDIIRSIICVLTDRGVVEEFLKRITEIEIKNTRSYCFYWRMLIALLILCTPQPIRELCSEPIPFQLFVWTLTLIL